MFEIIIDGRVAALCSEPRYVKIKEDSGAFVETSRDEAIGVAVNGVVYNIDGREDIPNTPQAIVRESDVSEYVFGIGVKVTENENHTRSALVDVEIALCESDANTDERFKEVEEALCEIDVKINGGGE